MDKAKKFYFLFMLALVVLLSGLFYMNNSTVALSGNKFEKELAKEEATVRLVREVKDGAYAIITTQEVKNLIDTKKDFILIDTMPYETSYLKGHIPKAKHFMFPIPEMKTWDNEKTADKTIEEFETLLGQNKNKQIIIYCGFLKCTRSHNGASWAKKLGYNNVYRYPGGIFAWKGAKFKIDKPKNI